MTGPPTPRPVPGSNAIGSFAIGISPIGSIPAFDVWNTIISQYSNSPVLAQLLTDFAQYLDPTLLADQFFDAIFNVDTAVGYGLEVWGRRVGVSKTLHVTTATFFGFEQQAPTVDTFGPGGSSPFYVGVPATNNYDLSDDAFRRLIFAKMLANVSDCSIPSLNQLLLNLFPNRGNAYVTDGGDMTMQYVFSFALSPVEQAIVASSGVLPKPAGVSMTIVQL